MKNMDFKAYVNFPDKVDGLVNTLSLPPAGNLYKEYRSQLAGGVLWLAGRHLYDIMH